MPMINIRYISPLGDTEFNKKDDIYLVLLNLTSKKDKININYTKVNKINNVSEQVRGYVVDKSVDIDYPINIMLFSYNLRQTTVLFSNIVHAPDDYFVLDGRYSVHQSVKRIVPDVFLSKPFIIGTDIIKSNKLVIKIDSEKCHMTKLIYFCNIPIKWNKYI